MPVRVKPSFVIFDIYLYFYGEMAELYGSSAAVDVRNSASEIDMKWLRKSQLVEKKYEKNPEISGCYWRLSTKSQIQYSNVSGNDCRLVVVIDIPVITML